MGDGGSSSWYSDGFSGRELTSTFAVLSFLCITARVKISDMGLARKLDDDRQSFSTLSPGTFGWAAPECLQRQRLTKAVDVFACGCVLYYMLTGGKHPFGDRYVRVVVLGVFLFPFAQTSGRERGGEGKKKVLTGLVGHG